MARNDALIRLHQNLQARRSELYKRLGLELQDLGKSRGGSNSGDAADAAFSAGSEELSSRLAELEARELRQIERALQKMKRGTYGSCELCQCKIPVARLDALPYSTLCVNCQREVETNGDWEFNAATGSWENLSEGDGFDDRRRFDIAGLEVDLAR
ncbi:MAG: TraR/DksA family transcriptional regulator [Gemmataceae bacterium]|nr:TraR/DksA family transcriptional regulator [Gemmataceae bacterium]